MKTPHRGTVPKHKQASNYATRVAGIKSGPKYGRQQHQMKCVSSLQFLVQVVNSPEVSIMQHTFRFSQDFCGRQKIPGHSY